jgi:hypothetical protein
VAVSEDGYEYTFSGGMWSDREVTDVNAGTQIELSAVSCPTGTYCAALTDRGYVYTYSRA